jgi:hypothetical protein
MLISKSCKQRANLQNFGVKTFTLNLAFKKNDVLISEEVNCFNSCKKCDS